MSLQPFFNIFIIGSMFKEEFQNLYVSDAKLVAQEITFNSNRKTKGSTQVQSCCFLTVPRSDKQACVMPLWGALRHFFPLLFCTIASLLVCINVLSPEMASC